ncbi:Cof-type HAD-IIB family hydrolase [Paenibacillus hexagrammi]|uniref:Cof-type HAD-IIB family hydrolase n=1 Tax=Paenibacillus hexagrammi TaxID=2908839 RepID=A0ABY3SFE7_9BACL|nr:Cof-type HAD-IIB family hydrolase [Paenibacillus sp. YPD9-1]UJF32738.1 Cof-type HAD-IIB family hydrolase [Paenibacillus sp. YPD9-1]
MTYKLIAADLDDTLLRDDLTISQETVEAIHQAVAKGVTFTIATGRSFPSAAKIANRIGLNVPIITYQGALIKNLQDEEVLYERNVPLEAARFLLDFSEKRNLHLQLYHGDELYAGEDNDKIKKYVSLSKTPYLIGDLRQWIDIPQPKMLIVDEPTVCDQLREELLPLLGDQLHITKSKPHYLEFMHKEGTKGHAIEFLAQHIGCGLDQVIALGDAWNDREMLQVAGMGVAMDNALPELKELANYVTRSNNEDGVRHVIEKFVLV